MKKARGFTLIELLVVVSIVGTLSSIIMAPFNESRKKSRDSKRISEIKSIESALSIYADDHSGCYPDGSSYTNDENSISSFNYKYLSKTLYSKILNQNQNMTITPWTANQPYNYRAFGDYLMCPQSAGGFRYYPSYQLFVELETKSDILNSDQDNDFTFYGSTYNGFISNPTHTGLNLSDFYDCGSVYVVIDPCNLKTTNLNTSREVCINDTVGDFDCVYELSGGAPSSPIYQMPLKFGVPLPPVEVN